MHGLSVKARLEPRSEVSRIGPKFTKSSLPTLNEIVRNAHFEGYDIGIVLGKCDLKRAVNREGDEIVRILWASSNAKAELDGRLPFGEFHQIPNPCPSFVKKMARSAFGDGFSDGYDARAKGRRGGDMLEHSWMRSDANRELMQISNLLMRLRRGKD